MKSGIYSITNIVNNKVYIGRSNNISMRLYSHKYKLRTNTHDNKHLQYSWNKFGEDKFVFEVIEECEADLLYEREKFWIEFYDACNPYFGYNIQEAIRLSYKYGCPKEEIPCGLIVTKEIGMDIFNKYYISGGK
jgi:group I intron endonuclease